MKHIGLVIGLGIDIASAALFIASRMFIACSASSPMPMVPVVVAARDIPQGVLIDRTAVYVALWPAGSQPAQAFTAVDAVVGRISARDIRQGDAFTFGRPPRQQPTDLPDVKTMRVKAEGVW